MARLGVERMLRQDTTLESEGAEFLVLGQLLIEGIPTFKAYRNQKGYDLVATSNDTGRSARIQVKSRWATNAGQHLIRDFNFDFVVLVRLNRGFGGKKRHLEGGKLAPEFFVIPLETAKSVTKSYGWGKVMMSKAELIPFQDRWDLVGDFLQSTGRGTANAPATKVTD